MLRPLASIVLVGCLLWQAGHALAKPLSQAGGEPSPPEGKVIILSDSIGSKIDRAERDQYGLFPGIPDFLSATIIQKPDGIYVA